MREEGREGERGRRGWVRVGVKKKGEERKRKRNKGRNKKRYCKKNKREDEEGTIDQEQHQE